MDWFIIITASWNHPQGPAQGTDIFTQWFAEGSTEGDIFEWAFTTWRRNRGLQPSTPTPVIFYRANPNTPTTHT